MTWLSMSGAYSCSGFASWYGIWDFAMKRELNSLQELLGSRPASFIGYLKDRYLHSNTQNAFRGQYGLPTAYIQSADLK